MSPRADYEDRLKDYTDVKERVRLFYERHPDGRLQTTRVAPEMGPDGKPRVVVEAKAWRTPDDPLPGTGSSWLELPGTTPYTRGSELENAETSAWGRAIGCLGIGIAGGIGSKDEIKTKAGDEPLPDPMRDGLIGTAEIGKGSADFELRQGKEGMFLQFKLKDGRRSFRVDVDGGLAEALQPFKAEVIDHRVTVWGRVVPETFTPKDSTRKVTFYVIKAVRIATADWTLPAPDTDDAPDEGPADDEFADLVF